MKVVAAVALLVVAAALPAHAGNAGRHNAVGPAAACQPFSPTPDVRYSAGGLRNAGSTSIYVACSVDGPELGAAPGTSSPTGVVYVEVRVRNPTSSRKQMSCTLRPGYSEDGTTTSQGAYPQSTPIDANATGLFWWPAENVLGAGATFAAPNLTCSLPPGMSVMTIKVWNDEFIGN